jgi:hypothetical protein
MTCPYKDQIVFLASGHLSPDEAETLNKHMSGCTECQAEWNFWKELAAEVMAEDAALMQPVGIDTRALAVIHGKSAKWNPFWRGLALLKAQAYLVRRELWPATAGIMALGVIMVILSKQAEFLTFLAPLVAAASLAAIYGPQNDPACELAASTPTSPWKVLLSRLTLVSGYNLLLALASSLVLLLVFPADILGGLILSWLGPLTLLSALALMLSLWIGTGNAITISYALWIIQYIQPPLMIKDPPALRLWEEFLTGYRQFWQTPGLLILLAALIILGALLSTRHSEQYLSPYSG